MLQIGKTSENHFSTYALNQKTSENYWKTYSFEYGIHPLNQWKPLATDLEISENHLCFKSDNQ